MYQIVGLGKAPKAVIAANPALKSNGISEAFVNTLRRDDIAGADLATSAIVLDQIPTWLANYNVVAPPSALYCQSSRYYRSTMLVAALTS